MKKLTMLLVAVIILAMSIPAFAAEPTTVLDGDKYTTSGADEAYANKLMTILAISGESITIDSIQYIGQTQADENGAYSFNGYLPKADPVGEAYKVLVGGETVGSPMDAGLIGVFPGVDFSGSVYVSGEKKSALVKLINKDDPMRVYEVLASESTGEYLIDNIEKGVYNAEVTMKSNLKHIKNNINIQGNSQGNIFTLKAGDVDENDHINILDIALIVNVFNGDAAANPQCDVNNDGEISIYDISLAITNFNQVSIVE